MIVKALLLLVPYLLLCSCCGTDPFETPPSGLVSVGSASTRGQGIRFGNRVVTAGHNFPEFPPDEVWINGLHQRIEIFDRGDAEVVNGLYDQPPSLAELLADWLAFEGVLTSDEPRNWSRGDGQVVPGEVLYAFRSFDGGAIIRAVRLEVLRVHSDVPVPRELVVVRSRTDSSFSGWSGCFVGRYRRADACWEFVGILLGSLDRTRAGEQDHMILRPPEHVLDWLLEPAPSTFEPADACPDPERDHPSAGHAASSRPAVIAWAIGRSPPCTIDPTVPRPSYVSPARSRCC